MTRRKSKRGLLWGARVYLSGPMDFVASREEEMKFGWRNRVAQFLRQMGVEVFDPWFKPDVVGFHEYGKESSDSLNKIKRKWTFSPGHKGYKARAECAQEFWKTLHIDLRMVDTSDFTIAYCPTNIYSVGTVHEIVMARLQHKPVLFVSPPVQISALDKLRKHLKNNKSGLDLLKELEDEVPVKHNPNGIPSLWYMPLLGGHSFFDGFGFGKFSKEFNWKRGQIEIREEKFPPKRPLLPLLIELNRKIPHKYDIEKNKYVLDDDWLLWDLSRFRDEKRRR